MPRVKIVGPDVSIPAVVGVILVILKLAGVIDWSWWLVLLPLYLPWVVFIAMVAWVMFLLLHDSRESGCSEDKLPSEAGRQESDGR